MIQCKMEVFHENKHFAKFYPVKSHTLPVLRPLFSASQPTVRSKADSPLEGPIRTRKDEKSRGSSHANRPILVCVNSTREKSSEIRRTLSKIMFSSATNSVRVLLAAAVPEAAPTNPIET